MSVTVFSYFTIEGHILSRISSSSFFSSVGCADDEALTRLFQTSLLLVFLVALPVLVVFGYFSPSDPP